MGVYFSITMTQQSISRQGSQTGGTALSSMASACVPQVVTLALVISHVARSEERTKAMPLQSP